MAFNTLEYLENGNVDFVYNLTPYDYKNLIKYVRESDRRVKIVNGFLSKIRDTKSRFCFEIIYDMDEFIGDTKYILDKYYDINVFSKELLEKFLSNSSLGIDYLNEHFDEIICKYIDDLDFIFKILFENIDKCLNLLKKLSLYDDLHIRYLFMKYLVIYHTDMISLFYDDISKYLTSETFQENEQLSFVKEFMPVKDVCDLAIIYFESNIDYFTWERFKKFILDNYQYNNLAYRLLENKKERIDEHSYRLVPNLLGIEEFNKDPNTLFATTSCGRLNILEKYSSKISLELIQKNRQYLHYFYEDGELSRAYKWIDYSELSRKLEFYVDKYLSLSDDKTYDFILSGSTASCFRIGDYVFKLVKTKWSYEEIICPDLYLILPNLEEDFIRDRNGIVTSGIEIQRYLSRDAREVPSTIFSMYREELSRLGYYTTDTLINGSCGDNCRLLDSYLDSGNLNPPDWFREYPLVLVDRDRVYRKSNRNPKQLRSGY